MQTDTCQIANLLQLASYGTTFYTVNYVVCVLFGSEEMLPMLCCVSRHLQGSSSKRWRGKRETSWLLIGYIFGLFFIVYSYIYRVYLWDSKAKCISMSPTNLSARFGMQLLSQLHFNSDFKGSLSSVYLLESDGESQEAQASLIFIKAPSENIRPVASAFWKIDWWRWR